MFKKRFSSNLFLKYNISTARYITYQFALILIFLLTIVPQTENYFGKKSIVILENKISSQPVGFEPTLPEGI